MSFCDKKSLDNCIKAYMRRWVGYNDIGHFPLSTGVNRNHPNFDPRSDDWFRPHNNCNMRYTGSPLCSVCAAELIRKMEAISGNFFEVTNIAPNSIILLKANYIIWGIYSIPPVWNNRLVTSIGSSAFANQTQMTRINIPSNITTIGSNAFLNSRGSSIYIQDRTITPSTFNYNWNPSMNPIYLNGVHCNHSTATLTNLSSTVHGIMCPKCRTTGNIQNHSHTHIYSWTNYKQHRGTCECGALKQVGHVVSSSDTGFPYKTCLQCGGPVETGFVINGITSFVTFTNFVTVTLNFGEGSYVLSNGVIVLSDVDTQRYLNGELGLPEIEKCLYCEMFEEYYLHSHDVNCYN